LIRLLGLLGLLEGLERLGRALVGYRTGPPVTSPSAPPSPDGTGAPYTFPADYSSQTEDIRQTIDILKSASSLQLGAERSSLGARLNKLQSARSVVEVAQVSAQESLSGLQDTDIAESATNLSEAKTALEATMTVSGQVLRLTILDYL
jgi:flagellin-like hook-associated protein FlgL